MMILINEKNTTNSFNISEREIRAWTTGNEERSYSFFLRWGSVGTNTSFRVPCLVTSFCFLARLPIAFGVDVLDEGSEEKW